MCMACGARIRPSTLTVTVAVSPCSFTLAQPEPLTWLPTTGLRVAKVTTVLPALFVAPCAVAVPANARTAGMPAIAAMNFLCTVSPVLGVPRRTAGNPRFPRGIVANFSGAVCAALCSQAAGNPAARALLACRMRARVVACDAALPGASRWRDIDAIQVRGGRPLPGCPRPGRLPRRLRDARAAAFRDGLSSRFRLDGAAASWTIRGEEDDPALHREACRLARPISGAVKA